MHRSVKDASLYYLCCQTPEYKDVVVLKQPTLVLFVVMMKKKKENKKSVEWNVSVFGVFSIDCKRQPSSVAQI